MVNFSMHVKLWEKVIEHAIFFLVQQAVGITISFFIGIRVEIRLKGVCEHTRMQIGVEIAIAMIPYRGTMIVPSRCMHGNVLQ